MSESTTARVAGLALALGVTFGGCTCESRKESPTETAPAPLASVDTVAEPTGPLVKGFLCPGPGAVKDPPASSYHFAPWAVEKLPHWEEPTDESSRFINVAGVRDIARAADQAWMVRHRIPDDKFVVLTAKTHQFPPGTTFDEKGKQKAFDEVGASPHAMLLGVRAITWGGRPAVEGAVAAVPESGERTLVHHLILPLEGENALVVTYLGFESQFHRYFAEACDAVSAAK